MTITAIDITRTRKPVSVPAAASSTPVAPVPAATASSDHSPLHVVPTATEARGFALYVGIDEFTAAAAGVALPTIVQALREKLAELIPTAESYATVALAPRNAGGRDVDVVRQALKDPSALAARRAQEARQTPHGVVVDFSRNTVTVDGDGVPLTYKELRLLQHLIANEGRTVQRAELITELWSSDDDDAPNERTIDVHVRRLRAKLGAFEDIIRTVRGTGYRFDSHADVQVRPAA